VANLIRVALGLVDKHNVVEKIKAAGRQVYDATGRFLSDVRARVAALKLPWTKSAAEGYFEPSPGIPVKVRAGGVDREERRIPGGGKPFADWFEFEGKRYDAPELVVVPAGTFDMGSTPDQIAELKRRYPSVDAKWFDAEGPLRKAVRVPAPFAIGRFAVTRGQFAAFQRDTGHRMDGGAWGWSGTEVKHDPKKNWQAPGFTQDETHPAVGISHLDATAYCQWLSKNTGKSYRLPTETEWEYACRAGTRTWFWWGDEISAEQANYDSNFAFGAGKQAPYRERTVPVESFKPNPWSLWQVHGNVLEWCQDHWHDSYAGAPHDSGAWPDGDKSLCVLRGGSWYSDPPDTRAADRDRSQPVDRSVWSGFRVARTL
jgi:formylglycine-generating enzyme required for sulfatase activity